MAPQNNGEIQKWNINISWITATLPIENITKRLKELICRDTPNKSRHSPLVSMTSAPLLLESRLDVSAEAARSSGLVVFTGITFEDGNSLGNGDSYQYCFGSKAQIGVCRLKCKVQVQM